jgi:hypothetical protein
MIEEYFRTDFQHSVNTIQTLEIGGLTDGPRFKFKVKTIIDFDSATFYIAVLFEQGPPSPNALELICKNPFAITRAAGGREIQMPHAIFLDGHHFELENVYASDEKTRLLIAHQGLAETNQLTSDELSFSRRVFCYTDTEVSRELRQALFAIALKHNIVLSIRDAEYAFSRYELKRPLAFISHDSRDKNEIARPLADALINRNCPTWYDSYTLNPGANLRDSIEEGLRTCYRAIIIITPNFLSNPGWTKVEFEAVFTRELLENQNLIIPIWANVTQKEIFEYSPTLANRFALIWDGNAEETADKLMKHLRGLSPHANLLSGMYPLN